MPSLAITLIAEQLSALERGRRTPAAIADATVSALNYGTATRARRL